MTPKLQAFLIVFWSSIAGLLVVAMVGTLLYRISAGSYVMPAAIEVQLINTLVIVLAAAGPFVAGWMNRRRIDASNDKTLAAVGEVTYILKNGLKTEIARETAALVGAEARSVAGILATGAADANTAAVEANTQATHLNTEARTIVGEHNTAAVQENTVATDLNTEARQP